MNKDKKFYLVSLSCMMLLSLFLAYTSPTRNDVALFIIGPPFIALGLLNELFNRVLPDMPLFLFLVPTFLAYYGLACLPIVFIRRSPLAAMVWVFLTLGFHFLFFWMSQGLARM